MSNIRVTYVASDNSAGDAQVLGNAGEDIFVRKVIFGTPADGKITHFYNKRVAPGHASGMGSVATTDLVLKHTQPTAAAGKDWERFLNFTDAPLQLDGGSFHTDASQVTVIWEPVDEAKQ